MFNGFCKPLLIFINLGFTSPKKRLFLSFISRNGLEEPLSISPGSLTTLSFPRSSSSYCLNWISSTDLRWRVTVLSVRDPSLPTTTYVEVPTEILSYSNRGRKKSGTQEGWSPRPHPLGRGKHSLTPFPWDRVLPETPRVTSDILGPRTEDRYTFIQRGRDLDGFPHL